MDVSVTITSLAVSIFEDGQEFESGFLSFSKDSIMFNKRERLSGCPVASFSVGYVNCVIFVVCALTAVPEHLLSCY